MMFRALLDWRRRFRPRRRLTPGLTRKDKRSGWRWRLRLADPFAIPLPYAAWRQSHGRSGP